MRWLIPRIVLWTTLFLAVVALGFMLLSNVLLYEKAQYTANNQLAIWLNREVLMHGSYDQPMLPYGGGFCRIEELPKVPSGALFGQCYLFDVSFHEGDCWFWWLGRICLRLATSTELYSSDLVRESFTKLVPRLCDAKDEVIYDRLCSNILFDRPVLLDVYITLRDGTLTWELETESAERARL